MFAGTTRFRPNEWALWGRNAPREDRPFYSRNMYSTPTKLRWSQKVTQWHCSIAFRSVFFYKTGTRECVPVLYCIMQQSVHTNRNREEILWARLLPWCCQTCRCTKDRQTLPRKMPNLSYHYVAHAMLYLLNLPRPWDEGRENSALCNTIWMLSHFLPSHSF